MKKYQFFLILTSIIIFTHFVSNAQHFEQVAKTFPRPYFHNAQDNFGKAMALADNILIVGAPGDGENEEHNGALYFYNKTEAGWSFIRKLKPSELDLDIDFGSSIATDGAHLVIGHNKGALVFNISYNDSLELSQIANLTYSEANDTNYFYYNVKIYNDVIGIYTDYNDGRVLLFEKPDSGWGDMTETANLSVNNLDSYDWFAVSIDISDEIVLVGSPRTFSQGKTFVFEKPESGWVDMTYTSVIRPDEDTPDYRFGWSVGISGERVFISSPWYNSTGVIYEYKKSDNGWVELEQRSIIKPQDLTDEDRFGYNIFVSNDYLLAASPYNDGKAYVFYKPDSDPDNITEIANLNRSNIYDDESFGRSLILLDDYILISETTHTEKGENAGGVYIYEKQDNAWINANETYTLLPNSYHEIVNGGNQYGNDVDIDSDYAVVGVNYDYELSNRGAAYVLHKTETGWENIAKLTSSNFLQTSNLGMSVSISGDQIVLGSRGAAYIYEKPEGGWEDMTETHKINTEGSTAYFGNVVDISGDQIVVGSKRIAYVYEKPATGWQDLGPGFRLSSSPSLDNFAESLAISGDQIVIGSKPETHNNGYRGYAFVYVKPETGWRDMNQSGRLNPLVYYHQDDFGTAVDIHNGVVIVSSPSSFQKSIYVFEEPSTGWTNMNETAILSSPDYVNLGTKVALSENHILTINGSGYVYIFEKLQESWETYEGGTKIDDGTSHSIDFVASMSISDGNIIIGSPKNDEFATNAGAAYIYQHILNMKPSFIGGESHVIEEDAGNQSFQGWATQISDGNDENSEFTFHISSDNDDLFEEYPHINPENGELTYKVKDHAYGVANMTVVLQDNGGIYNGGVDTSEEQYFTITVNSVNDNPVIADIILEDFCPENAISIDLKEYISDVDHDINTELIFSLDNSEVIEGFESNIEGFTLELSHEAKLSGEFNVGLIATDPLGGTVIFQIAINAIFPEITAEGNILTASAGESYQWFFNGNPLGGTSTETLEAEVPGNYSVEIKLSESCTYTSLPYYVDNKTGLIFTDISSEIQLYPNPFYNNFHIDISKVKHKSILTIIRDVNNKEVIHSEIFRKDLSLEQIPSGIYFLELIFDGKHRAVKKLVKL